MFDFIAEFVEAVARVAQHIEAKTAVQQVLLHRFHPRLGIQRVQIPIVQDFRNQPLHLRVLKAALRARNIGLLVHYAAIEQFHPFRMPEDAVAKRLRALPPRVADAGQQRVMVQ